MSSPRLLLVTLCAIALTFGCIVCKAADSHGWAMRFGTRELAKESKKFLPLLEEPDRPVRWRAQLALWRGMKVEYLQAEVQRAAEEARNEIETMSAHRRDLAITADLRARGQTAPSGQMPDVLQVLDEQRSVLVRNESDSPLSIIVWRHAEFEWARKPAHEWCPMAPGEPRGDFHTPFEIAPKAFKYFLLSDQKDCSRLNQSKVSVEIYEGDTLVWASEPMLLRRERIAKREMEKLQEKSEAATRAAPVDAH